MDPDFRKRHLHILNDRIDVCTRCALHRTRSRTLPGEGPVDAEIMLIGQGPGEDEDKGGRLWAGPAGELLDSLLAGAGLRREEVYLTNLLKCMLPGYRRPKIAEIEACWSYWREEIYTVDPRVLAPLGYYATKTILDKYELGNPRRDEYREIYGTMYNIGQRILLPLDNPAALIPAPEIAAKMRRNFARLGDLLKSDS